MRKGDLITIPVIAHNYLDQAKQIIVSLDIKGLDLVAGATKQITVASKSDGTALWRVKASAIGTADLVAKALTNEESDALELNFPSSLRREANRQPQRGRHWALRVHHIDFP